MQPRLARAATRRAVAKPFEITGVDRQQPPRPGQQNLQKLFQLPNPGLGERPGGLPLTHSPGCGPGGNHGHQPGPAVPGEFVCLNGRSHRVRRGDKGGLQHHKRPHIDTLAPQSPGCLTKVIRGHLL
ncbi:MAG: hypothetical protein ACK559_13200, partial [bacterium]